MIFSVSLSWKKGGCEEGKNAISMFATEDIYTTDGLALPKRIAIFIHRIELSMVKIECLLMYMSW